MQTKSGNEAYMEWLPSGPLEFKDIEYLASLGRHHGLLHHQHMKYQIKRTIRITSFIMTLFRP